MVSLQESVDRCLKFYGDNILSDEVKKDAFGRFGYNTYVHAVEKYKFKQEKHSVPQKYIEAQEKERERLAGIATSKTKLTF